MKHRSIALDGPSGAGKSTLAKRLAAELGYLYVDTGAIYRTLGLYMLRQGVDPGDAQLVEALLPRFVFRMDYGADGLQRMYLDGEDVTEEIRQPQVSPAASKVSAIPAVRAFLLDTQRQLARDHDVIMDGRDIGTVVLPQADVKIFLTASPQARAQRRYNELIARGSETDLDTVLRDMMERDARDTQRAAAPLKPAQDAVTVDTSDYSFEESLAVLLKTIRERLA